MAAQNAYLSSAVQFHTGIEALNAHQEGRNLKSETCNIYLGKNYNPLCQKCSYQEASQTSPRPPFWENLLGTSKQERMESRELRSL